MNSVEEIENEIRSINDEIIILNGKKSRLETAKKKAIQLYDEFQMFKSKVIQHSESINVPCGPISWEGDCVHRFQTL